jgi:hypothetical protein
VHLRDDVTFTDYFSVARICSLCLLCGVCDLSSGSLFDQEGEKVSNDLIVIIIFAFGSLLYHVRGEDV